MLWSPGDQISVFYGSGTNGGSCFTAQNTEVAATANFTGTIGVITGGNDISPEDTYFWATYPYCANASCNGSTITTVLPAAQIATADTFADDLFPTIGRSHGLNIAFYSIGGGLKFTVSEEGITSVTLQGHNEEPLAGTLTVGFDGGVPVVTNIADSSTSITLTAPEGEAFEVGRSYYMVFVPTVFENGFTLTFSKGYARAVYDRTKSTTLRRSAFGSLNTPDTGLEWEQLYVNIPDPNFRDYMIANFDTNDNGVLDFSEAEAVTIIDVCTDNIRSVVGIEYCANLQRLTCRGSNRTWNSKEHRYVNTGTLEVLDVSSNTKLYYLLCDKNQLSTLNVSSNTELSCLSCANNQLTTLDLSSNIKLVLLSCDNNQLSTLNVSSNTELTVLSCANNQLTTLDLSSNTELTVLSCSNNQLTTLDLSSNTKLYALGCSRNQLIALNLSTNVGLEVLKCRNNLLTTLDVSANLALGDLECSGNQLIALDVSNNTALTGLSCNSNQLTALDVSNNTALTRLDCSPMNDSLGNNLLGYLYIAQGQSIPYVTVDRSTEYIPSETIILVAPESGGNEGTVDEPLN